MGTGTSQGVPMIACDCEVCTSSDSRNKRLRTSIHIESASSSIVIDAGPDFRYQMLRNKVKRLDAIVFTHGHKDHIAGLDDVRAYNHFQQKEMDVYADEYTQQNLKKEYAYIFENKQYPGIPQVRIHSIDDSERIQIGDIQIQPFYVKHLNLPVLGFKINNFVYITDANFISEEVLTLIQAPDILVLNALRHEKHVSHFTLSEAIAISEKVKSKCTYFTHISHQLGLHEEVSVTLPKNHFLAYDTLQIWV